MTYFVHIFQSEVVAVENHEMISASPAVVVGDHEMIYASPAVAVENHEEMISSSPYYYCCY
jgi:hypothetical protein